MATFGTRLFTLFRGQYIGRDEFGNTYYQERRARKGAKPKRWVVYKGIAEPTKVPPHWHGWLHYTTNQVPLQGKPSKNHDWQKDHLPNATGTKARYVPHGHISKGGKRAASSADYVAWKPE